MQQVALRKALNEWDAVKAIDWDTAVCLHAPKAMRASQQGWDAMWLSRVLRCYFNKVDKGIAKKANLKTTYHCKRLVMLEYQERVGWHCHFTTETPSLLSQERFHQTLQNHWLKLTKPYQQTSFDGRLVWVEPLYGNYRHYSTNPHISP